MEKSLAQSRLVISRIFIYGFLTLFALLMMFPLIYMVIASLKTTKDFSSNPRRLIPYTQVTEEVNGREVGLYSFIVNGNEQSLAPSLIDAQNTDKLDFGYFTTQPLLESQLKLGTQRHADQRRLVDARFIIPLHYFAEDGSETSLEDQALTLISRGETVDLTPINGNTATYQVYDVFVGGEKLASQLAGSDNQVPVLAYALDNSESITLQLRSEVNLVDGSGRGRDYPVYEMVMGDGSLEQFVMAYNSTINVFIDPDNFENVVYAIEANVKAVEAVEFQIDNYNTVLGRTEDKNFQLDRALVNTAFVTVLVTIGQMVTSIFGGYAFSRIPFRGRDALFMVYLGSIMVPFVVLIVPIYRLMTVLGWNDHLVALIVPWIFTAYGTFLIRQFFLSIPKEIEEAALLDGCGRFRILWTIFVPLSTPVIATHAIFTFLYAWNSFIWPLIIINTGNKDDHVLTLALVTLANINADKPNLVMTGAAVMILPPILVFILAQRYFIEGIATSGLKG